MVTKPSEATAVAVPYPQPGPPEASQAPYVVHVDGASPPLAMNSSEVRVGAWGATFCGCFAHIVPNCCMATCLPCLSMAQIASRMGIATYSQAFTFFGWLWLLTGPVRVLDYMMELSSIRFNHIRDVLLEDARGAPILTYHVSLLSTIAWIATLVSAIAIWYVRFKIRQRFDIPGNCLCDCCATFLCSCCVIAQMATHIKSYKPGTCDFGPVDTLPACQ